MKPHPFAQAELQRMVVDAAPRRGQAGLLAQRAGPVDEDRAFEEAGEDPRADIGLFAQGFQRGGGGDFLHRDGYARAIIAAHQRRGLGDGNARGDEGGGEQATAR